MNAIVRYCPFDLTGSWDSYLNGEFTSVCSSIKNEHVAVFMVCKEMKMSPPQDNRADGNESKANGDPL